MKKLESLGKKMSKMDQKKVMGGKNKVCGVQGDSCGVPGGYQLCCSGYACINVYNDPVDPNLPVNVCVSIL